MKGKTEKHTMPPGKQSLGLIDVDTLELVFATVIRDLRLFDVSKVALTEDYYWDIAGDQFDIINEPKLGVGQLHDDWKMLQDIVTDKERVVTSVDLEALAGILDFLSFKEIFTSGGDQEATS
ncbi:MAG: hypothetical protein AB7F76_14430 [Parvibaculaceae bacterium]